MASTSIATSQATSASTTLLVRIKPFNPRAGCKLKTYTFMGRRFREEAGWYKVDGALADQLRDLLQDESDPLSQSVFDVLTEDQAQRVEEAELQKRERASAMRPNRAPEARGEVRRSAANPGVLTTADLNQAPNDELPPNGYPNPRTFPQPQSGSGASSRQPDVEGVLGRDTFDGAVIDDAAKAGVDDKTLAANSANVARDAQHLAPRMIDGEPAEDDEGGPVDNEPIEPGDTDFGPDNSPEVDEHGQPASPPSARRARRNK